MHVNEQHKEHATTCMCDSSIFPLELASFVDEVGEDGWWDWHVQEDYEYMSPKFWKCLGYNPDEIKNHPSEWQTRIFPEDLPATIDNFQKHCETQGKFQWKQQVRYKHKNGSTVTVICQGKVIEWDKDNKPLRVIGTHSDITEMKIMADKLAKQAALFKSAFMLSPAATLLYKPNEEIINSNLAAEDLLKTPKNKLVGKSCFDFSHPEDKKLTIEKAKLAKEDAMQQFHKRYISSEGEEILCDCTLNYINESEDYYVMQFIDITYREKTKQNIIDTIEGLKKIINK